MHPIECHGQLSKGILYLMNGRSIWCIKKDYGLGRSFCMSKIFLSVEHMIQ